MAHAYPCYGIKEISNAGQTSTIVKQAPQKAPTGYNYPENVIPSWAKENGYTLISLDPGDCAGAFWSPLGEIVRLEVYNKPEYVNDFVIGGAMIVN